MAPEEIHALGLKQIDEIEAEMLAVAHKLGFNDLASLNDHIKNESSFYATSGQQVLDLYTNYARGMEAELPKLFGHLPNSKLTVIPMEASRSKNAVPADYSDGAADGSRPGHINVNEWNPEHRLVLNIEAIAYHEGIPGHHLQLSLAQEMTNLLSFGATPDTPRSWKAGLSMRNGWEKKSVAIRIRTAITDVSKTRCGERSGS